MCLLNKKRRNKITYLYHYTKMNNFIEIIKSNTFILSEYKNANDYKEKSTVRKTDIDKYRYISFVSNPKLEYYSYSNSAMWYNYTDKNKGVCICFDKNKILSYLECAIHGRIKYRNGVSHIDQQSILEYLMEKREVWSYEDEYRIIYENKHSNIQNILDCINSIYLGPEVDSTQVGDIIAIIPKHIVIYKTFFDSTDGRIMSIIFNN